MICETVEEQLNDEISDFIYKMRVGKQIEGPGIRNYFG